MQYLHPENIVEAVAITPIKAVALKDDFDSHEVTVDLTVGPMSWRVTALVWYSQTAQGHKFNAEI